MRILTPLLALAAAVGVSGAAHAQTLKTVQDRGSLICGVNPGLEGFAAKDSNGQWSGLDVDFCRALAAAILNDPRNEVHVLHVEGVPAGFAELDRRQEGEIELVQFGLMPDFIGQGLGRYFLRWTIDRAWGYGPRRFWLHTCTLDHPAALPGYRKAGFEVYKEEMKTEVTAP